MRNTFLFLSILISSTLFLGCKKYDEGPKFTLRTVKHRLTKGEWKLQELTINGINQTDSYDEIDFNYQFTASANLGNSTIYTQSYTYSGQLYKVNGTVVFSKDDAITMIMDYGYASNGSGYYPDIFSYDNNDLSPVWKIKELTEKEFWLESVVDGTPVIMKLKKS